jgi:hypothetical protein
VGKLYASLAGETPPVYSSPVDVIGRLKLDEAYNRSAKDYARYGEAGLMDRIRAHLAKAAADVRLMADREQKLARAD